MYNTGKRFYFLKKEIIAKYQDVHFDMLWYIMGLTNIHRIHTEDAMREFLIRYFLIRDKPIEEYAIDVINDELIIDGYISNQYFKITMYDLVQLMGFERSDFKYNIDGRLSDFIEEYQFKPINIKTQQTGDKSFTISSDALAYALMGLKTLFEIDSCSIPFLNTLEGVSRARVASASKLAAYVVNKIGEAEFERFRNEFPSAISRYFNWSLKENKVEFNVFEDMDRENLAKIYEIHDGNSLSANQLRNLEIDDDFKHDMNYLNSHIVFAYGVKKGYVKLSDNQLTLINDIEPNFSYDYDELLGPDGEMYSTQEIYDNFNMAAWMDYLP